MSSATTTIMSASSIQHLCNMLGTPLSQSSSYGLLKCLWLNRSYISVYEALMQLFMPLLEDKTSQLQITTIIAILYFNRRQPGWFRRYLLPAKLLILPPSPLQSSEDDAIITNTDIFDVAVVTTLLVRLCLPQSTSFFAAPCRPLTVPLPQCQDLHYPPITYIVTLWLVIALIGVVEFGVSRSLTPSWSNIFLGRVFCASWCCYEAYSGPSIYFPGSGNILFSPIHFAMKTLIVTLLSCVVFHVFTVLGKFGSSFVAVWKCRTVSKLMPLQEPD